METMNKVQQALALYRESYEAAQKAASILSGGPADFYLGKLEVYVEALFTRFAPFKEGDRVELTVAPKTAGTGWSHCAHFLIPGAKGTVAYVDYIRRQGFESFQAGVVFDDESWVDKDGVVRPVKTKHSYCLWERELRRISVRPADAVQEQG